MRRYFLVIAAMAGVGGCTTPAPQNGPSPDNSSTPIASQPTATYQAYKLSKSEIDAVQDGVKSRLKDPGSAQFSGPTLAARGSTGDITVCGMVNAKNSYGGYVGASPYIATVRSGKVVDSVTGSARDEATILLGMCREKGVLL